MSDAELRHAIRLLPDFDIALSLGITGWWFETFSALLAECRKR